MKRRFTILSLMGLVLVLGIAIAALRNADDYWAGGMILATPFLLGVALIAALCGDERSRTRRLGFAILGGGYFVLAFLGLSEPYRTLLPTSRLLAYVHQQVAPPQTLTLTVTTSTGARAASHWAVVSSNSNPVPTYLVATTAPSNVPVFSSSAVMPNRWKSLLPGAANEQAFRIVGHCLFALLAGVLGAAIAQWFQKRRERAEPTSPAPAA
jgi:hypothetical protein